MSYSSLLYTTNKQLTITTITKKQEKERVQERNTNACFCHSSILILPIPCFIHIIYGMCLRRWVTRVYIDKDKGPEEKRPEKNGLSCIFH